jgi:hypothetical protein
VSDFRANKISDVSYFEFEPWTYYIDKENDDALTQTNGDKYTEEKHWEKHNNTIAAPLFRQEFDLAASLNQNVDANIYIDRGISAAFEKHLKLQEVRTMESLMNLQNGGFKINEY